MRSIIHRFFCLTTTVILLVAPGCNSKPNSGNYDPGSTNGGNTRSDSGQTGSGISDSAIADSIQDHSIPAAPALQENNLPDSPEELIRYLAQQSWLQKNTNDPPELVRILTAKLQAADKLLKKQLDDNQRFVAVQAKLDSLLRLIASGNSESRQEFLSFASRFENDSNPRVQQIAAVSLVVAGLNERLSKKDQNIDAVIEQASVVARSFPDSTDVCIELYNACELVAKNGTREQVIKLLKSLAGVYQDNEDPLISSVVALMDTRIELAALNLDVVFNRIRDDQPNAVSDLKTSLESLFAGDSLTLQTLQRIDNSVSWLEIEQRFDSAENVNQVLLDVTETIQDTRLQSQMRDLCIRRQVRIDLLGQLIADDLPLADGSQLDRSNLSGQNTIVVFWSPSEPASVDLIKQLAELRDKQAAPRWELLGVCTTRNPDVVRTLFGGSIPEWPNIIIADKTASLADRFGILQMPHVMLLDDQERFVSTTFPMTRLTEQLEKWSGTTDAQ